MRAQQLPSSLVVAPRVLVLAEPVPRPAIVGIQRHGMTQRVLRVGVRALARQEAAEVRQEQADSGKSRIDVR